MTNPWNKKRQNFADLQLQVQQLLDELAKEDIGAGFQAAAYTVHFQGAKHLSLTDLPLVSPLLANILQGGKADIDPYYCIETENELILKFFDST
ncbi:hypothetical protein QNH46_01090 [Paenibacillus woosongensis]|uniref:Uncharacterized protein n=1 Tax=Paenibacillus woosongensis TaxID=307580 RepID=A0AA95I872_9BACL|nr:hypothetical protein [Paenibacillus woosongensis]WHX49318.1 hypothetical protein QNH46_01090 [Paenibacillus woosongensis]